MTPIDIASIRRAAERLSGRIVRTPLLASAMLDELAGAKVLVKAEPLQKTGSFKIRGALNKILSTPEGKRKSGFVAFSSGNHGQAGAAGARMVGGPAAVVMPKGAPSIKIESCRWWGAEVVFFDRLTDDREAMGRKIEDERGMTLVPPFDDPDVMSGQGTMGLEIVEQLREAGSEPDALLVNCSGGGPASGVITAGKHALPGTRRHTPAAAGLAKKGRPPQSRGAPQKKRPPRPPNRPPLG